MKNILGTILPISGAVFIMTGIAGLINKLFDTHIGIGQGTTTEVPSDPVIIAILMSIGVSCLVLSMLFGKRNIVHAEN